MPKMECSYCGGTTETVSLRFTCSYCGRLVEPVRVSAFSQISPGNMGQIKQTAEASGNSMVLALCYLKAGNFTLAKKRLEKVIDESPECSEAYYYYALTLLNGRSFSELTMRDARKIAEYLQTAEELDPDFVYSKILFALLCIGYYDANELTPPADGYEILNSLGEIEVNAAEFEFLKNTLAPGLLEQMLNME